MTPCVNAAIKAIDGDGTLASSSPSTWPFAATPVIAP